MKLQTGFTLIELMIGITIGLVILIGAESLFMTTFGANLSDTKQLRFEQTLQVLSENMVSEIRRAGFSKPNISLTKQANNLYYNAQTNCITFSHSTPDANEVFYGYKLQNKIVYYYNSITTNGSCANLTNWTPVTDSSQIKINTLSFTTTGTSLVNITFTAEAVGLTLADGTVVNRNTSASVHIRNN